MKKHIKNNIERNDLLVCNKIISEKLIDNLSIKEEIFLYVEFIKYYVARLSQNIRFEEDIKHIELYLKGELSRKKLTVRHQLAVDNLNRLDDYDQSIQNVILPFLDYYVLDGVDQDNDLQSFLTSLFNIDKNLCNDFFNFITKRLLNN